MFYLTCEALQKEVAETAISGTPTARYDICRGRFLKGFGLFRWLFRGETLGKGTYGEVVKAKDKRTRQVRAIKIINKEKASH